MINVEQNYEKFKHYLSSYVERDNIKLFLDWLDVTDICEAPASTKYHLSCRGGLIQHSLNVFISLIKLLNMQYPDSSDYPYTKETIAIVTLLHDISKVNYYQKSWRNVRNEQTGAWESVPYYTVRKDALFFGSHEENSVYILSKFFKLTWEEEVAIRYHMGNVDDTDSFANSRMYTAYKESPLALLLHMADLMAICQMESNDGSEDVDPEESHDICIRQFIEQEEAKRESDIKSTDSETDDDIPF